MELDVSAITTCVQQRTPKFASEKTDGSIFDHQPKRNNKLCVCEYCALCIHTINGPNRTPAGDEKG